MGAGMIDLRTRTDDIMTFCSGPERRFSVDVCQQGWIHAQMQIKSQGLRYCDVARYNDLITSKPFCFAGFDAYNHTLI